MARFAEQAVHDGAAFDVDLAGGQEAGAAGTHLSQVFGHARQVEIRGAHQVVGVGVGIEREAGLVGQLFDEEQGEFAQDGMALVALHRGQAARADIARQGAPLVADAGEHFAVLAIALGQHGRHAEQQSVDFGLLGAAFTGELAGTDEGCRQATVLLDALQQVERLGARFEAGLLDGGKVEAAAVFR